MHAPTHTIDVTDASFEANVLAQSHTVPVVVDFWAPWCGPCRVLGPVLEKLAAEGGGRWILAKINTDENPQVAGAFRLSGIPAVKAFVNGELVAEFTGALPPAKVQHWLSGFLPSETDEKIDLGRQLVASGDLAAAEAAFQDALAGADPDHPAALVALAGLALDAGRKKDALDLIDRIPEHRRDQVSRPMARLELRLEADTAADLPTLQATFDADPTDTAARYNLALALIATERYEDGLAHLLEIVRRDRAFRDDAARKTMVKVFEIVGIQSDLAFDWRRKLGAAMY